MSQPFQPRGFHVRSAPGGAERGYTGQQYAGYAPQPVQEEYMAPPQMKEEEVRTSTATRHLLFSLSELGAGMGSNIVQMGTTVFSFMQIQMGVQDTTFQRYGMWGGWSQVATFHPAFAWISIVMAIGAQILLQMGCQVLSGKWKKEQLAVREEHQKYGFVQVVLSKEAAWGYTALGFVLDAVGDLGFAIAFNVPWYVCILFGLIMNGLSTVVLYDGDERFHYSYPIWWAKRTAKKMYRQAALEYARLAHGLSRDGRSLVRVIPSQQ